MLVKDFDEYFSGRLGVCAQILMRTGSALHSIPRAVKNGKPIYTYWGFRNFGDLLTPYLLSKVGCTPINVPLRPLASTLMVGSILDGLDSNYQGMIFGSGFLDMSKGRELKLANVVALRGELSRKAISLEREVVLGDPGLLMSNYYFPDKSPLTYRVGVIAHYEEKDLPVFKSLISKDDVIRIDVLRPPELVIDDILRCELIVSSSLHGIIMADSYGIPSVWVGGVSDRLEDKYHDYFSAFDERINCCNLSSQTTMSYIQEFARFPSGNVEIVKERLNKAFVESFV